MSGNIFNQSVLGGTMDSKKKKMWLAICFVIPAIIIFSTFIILPLINTIWKSFFLYEGFKIGEFVGFMHFGEIFKDEVFWKANINTWKLLAVQLLLCGPFSFLLAVLIRERPQRFKRFFKVAVVLPSVLNIAVITLMWKMMMQHEWGLFDRILTEIGLESLIRLWLQDEHLTIWIIGFVTLWQYLGFNMLYFYAGIKSIPESYYEAIEVEGAGLWHKTKNISIPLTQETIKFVLIISITGTMQIFTQIQLLTNGGPGDMTRSLIYQMYYTAFDKLQFGEAGAIAIVFAIQTFVLVLLVNRFVARNRLELV